MDRLDFMIGKWTAEKFRPTESRACADALRRTYASRGYRGSILRLATVGGDSRIYLRDPTARRFSAYDFGTDVLSDTGEYFGMRVFIHSLDYVFDPVHRLGVFIHLWQDKFDCDAHLFKITSLEPFGVGWT